jgi:hypothetical protein
MRWRTVVSFSALERTRATASARSMGSLDERSGKRIIQTPFFPPQIFAA